MNYARTMARLTMIIGILAVWSVAALAQQSTAPSEHEAHHPAAQAQSAESAAPQGSGMMSGEGMMGGQGMMGGKQMTGMPMMMPCCPCMMGGGMMGMGMMGGGKDAAATAKMMQMHAEMMKADAAILEKYAKEMGGQK